MDWAPKRKKQYPYKTVSPFGFECEPIIMEIEGPPPQEIAGLILRDEKTTIMALGGGMALEVLFFGGVPLNSHDIRFEEKVEKSLLSSLSVLGRLMTEINIFQRTNNGSPFDRSHVYITAYCPKKGIGGCTSDF